MLGIHRIRVVQIHHHVCIRHELALGEGKTGAAVITDVVLVPSRQASAQGEWAGQRHVGAALVALANMAVRISSHGPARVQEPAASGISNWRAQM